MSDRAAGSDPCSSSNCSRGNPFLLQASPQAVRDFDETVGLLWCAADIEILDEPPAALRFLRDFVAASRPCIIRNAVPAANNHSNRGAAPFLSLTLDALVERHPDLGLTVDATPDGHGDCVRQVVKVEDNNSNSNNNNNNKAEAEPMFVQPQERTMTLADFCRGLRASALHRNDRQPAGAAAASPKEIRERIFVGIASRDSEEDSNNRDSNKDRAPEEEQEEEEEPAILYYSRQNDCLRQELGPLWDTLLHAYHLPTAFSWAEEAFGTGPVDAVNLWMGHERAVSAMHKDHYENLFYVASGEKVFHLCPPADAPFLYERPVPSGRFAKTVRENGSATWKVVTPPKQQEGEPQPRVPWIAADVTRRHDADHLREFPLLRYAHPRTVRVRAGELLYLPALWFHRVTQSCETIGINYWYDMKFDSPSWCYFHLLQQLVPVAVQEEETERSN